MKWKSSLSRRKFLQVSTAAAVSGNLLLSCARNRQPESVLTSHEKKLVEAISDQIIPPDQDAGGKEAGVADFIEIQLAGPYKRFQNDYRGGLARLEATAKALRQKSFLDLSFDQQTQLLVILEGNQAPADIWRSGEAGKFFRMVRDHCMQGFYGSPRHGGNRNYVSWKMLNLDYPQVCGRNLT
jgi:gluconate 2-dehydrogenase gamma chain